MHNEDFANLHQAVRAKQVEVSADYGHLKRVIESCQAPVDGLHNKLKPINREVKDLHHSILNSYRSFENLGKLAGNIIGHDHSQKSLHKILNSGYRVAFNMLKDSDVPNQLSAMFGKMLSGFRASGGNVGAGGAYMVGERGPEVFVPHSGGNIIPNSGSSTKPISVVMHIHTPDAGSFSKSQTQIMAELAGALRRAEKNL